MIFHSCIISNGLVLTVNGMRICVLRVREKKFKKKQRGNAFVSENINTDMRK